MVNRVQFLDEAVCISDSAITLGKGMDPTNIPPDMRRGLFVFQIALLLLGKLPSSYE